MRDFIFIENDLIITCGDDSSIKIWKVDYERYVADCIAGYTDESIAGSQGENKNFKGIRIVDSNGLPPDRRGWLYWLGAIREKKGRKY